MTRHRSAALLTFALVGSAAVAHGQETASACTKAIARARALAAKNLRGRSLDIDRLSNCGREGAAAVGDVFHKSRASRDMELLEQLISYSTGQDGLVLLEPLLAVAQDREATSEARVVAMLGLMSLRAGQGGPGFWDITGGFDATGEPARGCGYSRTTTDRGRFPQPPPADRARIVAAAKRIRADSTASIDVRTAAACLAG